MACRRLGETCCRTRPATSQSLTLSTPPTARFTRATAPIAGAAANRLMAVAPETGPAPHEQRKVVAMQLSAQRVVLGGARTAAHQSEQYPTARTSIGVLEDIGYVAKGAERSPNGSASSRKAQSMRYVRSSGSPESASSSRFEACETSKQTTRWAPRKNAHVQPMSTNRQCLPGTLRRNPFPTAPQASMSRGNLDDAEDESLRASASHRSRRNHPG
jgi:hypothetical protein